MSFVSFGKTLCVLGMVGLLLAAVGSPVFGETYWTGTASNLWSNNANWTGDPTGTGIQINNGSNMPVLLNVADSAAHLYLGMSTGDNGSMTIADGADLNTGYGLFAAGIGGVGTVTQTGGSVLAGAMDLADEAAGIGTYTISGGSFGAIGGSMIGARGMGTLNIEGGDVSIASWSPGGNLTVGGVGVAAGGVIGVGLTSSINQTGGTFYATGQLGSMTLGVREGVTAIYNLDGGLFKLGTNIVNDAGIGYLKINGGTLQFQNGVDSGKSIDVDYLEIGTKDGVTAGYTQDWYYDKSIKAGTLTLGSDTSTGTLGILGGTVTVGDLIFGGTTSRVTLDDLLSISVLQSNYSEADALADVAAGYVLTRDGVGFIDIGTVDIGGANYTQLTAIINPMPGDATLDGKVDADDAAMLAGNWLSSNNVGWKQGDFNDDGKVNDIDATVLAANWGRTTEQQASVPEPAMPLLIVGGLLALFAWRKRLND